MIPNYFSGGFQKVTVHETFQKCAEIGFQARFSWQEYHQHTDRLFIVEALKRCSWNQTHAAKALRLHRNTLSRKLDELDINIRHERARIEAAKRPQGKAAAA